MRIFLMGLGLFLCAFSTIAAASDFQAPTVEQCTETLARRVLTVRKAKKGIVPNQAAVHRWQELASQLPAEAAGDDAFLPREITEGLAVVEEMFRIGDGSGGESRVSHRARLLLNVLAAIGPDDPDQVGFVLKGAEIQKFFEVQAKVLARREYRRREGYPNYIAMSLTFGGLLAGGLYGLIGEIEPALPTFLSQEEVKIISSSIAGVLGLFAPVALEGPNMEMDGAENFYRLPPPIEAQLNQIKRFADWPVGTVSYVGLTTVDGSLDLFFEKNASGEAELNVLATPLKRIGYQEEFLVPIAERVIEQ